MDVEEEQFLEKPGKDEDDEGALQLSKMIMDSKLE